MKPDKALEMALDADASRSTKKAAKKHGCTQRSVQHAIAQVKADPVLSLTFAEKRKELARRLHDLRAKVLERGANRIHDLMATEEDMHKVAGAYKIIADHHEVALGVLEDGGQHNAGTEPNTAAQEMASGKGAIVDTGWLKFDENLTPSPH